MNRPAPEWQAARPALHALAAPPAVEQALLRAFAERHARRPWYRRWTLDDLASWLGAGVVTCLLVLTTLGLHQRPPELEVREGFVPLASRERIQQAMHPQLVHAALPRAELVAMGIPIAADAPDELVRTELLVAASGEPLAIRLSLN